MTLQEIAASVAELQANKRRAVLENKPYTVPVRLLHSLEEAILAGARLIPDDMR